MDSPPEAWEPLLRVARLARRPLDRFLAIEAASGILLLVAAAIAMGLANSPWASAVHSFWQTTVGVEVGNWSFHRSLEWVVNDGLMVIFFFVVGLEIKREIHHGELSEWRRAALPLVGAMGGMVVPAIIYWLVAGAVAPHGWGTPMATDIAFALGVLALLGRRVPPALRVLLLALAVIDDLGAIVVIALFYSSGLVWSGLGVAAAGLAGIWVAQRFGIRSRAVYVMIAVFVWAGIYGAGIHPTIAGVLVGLMTPVRAWLGPDGFAEEVTQKMTAWSQVVGGPSSHEVATTLAHFDVTRREAMSPAEANIAALHPWVAYVIMPLFALANAGVTIDADALGGTSTTVMLGVALGLIAGKPLGVVAAAWVSTKLGFGTLPRGIAMRQLLVMGLVAGIGFTMAIFVAQLAFADATLLAAAKLGVLMASLTAGVLGLAIGMWLLPAHTAPDAAATADEAESSTER